MNEKRYAFGKLLFIVRAAFAFTDDQAIQGIYYWFGNPYRKKCDHQHPAFIRLSNQVASPAPVSHRP